MNKDRVPVKITLDRERTMRITMNTCVRLEEQHGLTMLEALSEMGSAEGKLDFKRLRLLLWAALVHEDEDLTPESVGNLVEISDLPEIQAKLFDCLNAQMTEETKKKLQTLQEDLEKKEQNGTGRRSERRPLASSRSSRSASGA